jgi:hypothetical protein
MKLLMAVLTLMKSRANVLSATKRLTTEVETIAQRESIPNPSKNVKQFLKLLMNVSDASKVSKSPMIN